MSEWHIGLGSSILVWFWEFVQVLQLHNATTSNIHDTGEVRIAHFVLTLKEAWILGAFCIYIHRSIQTSASCEIKKILELLKIYEIEDLRRIESIEELKWHLRPNLVKLNQHLNLNHIWKSWWGFWSSRGGNHNSFGLEYLTDQLALHCTSRITYSTTVLLLLNLCGFAGMEIVAFTCLKLFVNSC